MERLDEGWILIALAAIVLVLMTSGCAMRVSVTPIQQEEFTQKTVTNQFFDWVFNRGEGEKS